jgi:hypothetical protein
MTITNKPISQQGSTVAQQGASMADTAADSATSAIRSTQNVANEAFDPTFSDLAVIVHGISGDSGGREKYAGKRWKFLSRPGGCS